ncbi:MAG TPA: carboxylesterase family protein [Gammaproteobacteria bacterium]|nr:carboxylesterase family protein [Gammaproteobacteria bacterium]
MKYLLTRALIPLVLGILGTPAFAQVLTAKVTGGTVQGVAENDIAVFKGIPFAAPPTGKNRWRAPQPVEPWSGVKSADHFAPACMQDPQMLKFIGSAAGASEDCLYLDVWTPAKAPGDKLPVMVWIYGGGFAAGATSSPTYAGDGLARLGVVQVNVSYRLGAFGFLADPALSKESGKGSGNYGLLDQIAGLKWVRDNIAAFGGDPSNVTIFGESAGGISVSMLAASPEAKGLFERVISESGGSFGPPVRSANSTAAGENVPTLAVAEAKGEQFLGKLGAKNIAEARAMPAEEIIKAQGPGLGSGFWPVDDGHVLLGDQYRLYSQGRFNDTPVLIGTNSDEGASFVRGKTQPAKLEAMVRAQYGQRADTILAAYPHATEKEASRSAQDLMRDSLFGWSTWTWARLQRQHGRNKAFVYYFDHRTPQTPDGAPHASELPYVFRTLDVRGGNPLPQDAAVSDLMSRYWTNFAKTGDPNGPGLPKWPAFDEANQRAMVFDGNSGSAQPFPNLKMLKAMDAYFAWRRKSAAP